MLWSLPASSFASAQIVTDGLTNTTVVTNPSTSVTDVTTTTIIGGINALNSFETFNVSSGHTVNLHLPGEATNLLNLVHGETSHIDGVLNAVKRGEIGGNVYFLNPHGLVVGADGAINVGSFHAFTPTQEFMDDFFVGGATESVNVVLDGLVPISASGNITVRGTVNAVGDITLSAGDIENSGAILSGAVFDAEEPDFSDVVNVNGLASGGGVAIENGKVEIVAADDVVNSGVIATEGSDDLDAGEIRVAAGGSITLDAGSVVSADGRDRNASSGDITLIAERTDAPTLAAAEAKTSITLEGATIKGKNITIRATSWADHSWSVDDPGDPLMTAGETISSLFTGVNVAMAKADAGARIVVGDGTSLEAAGIVTLNASSTSEAGLMSLNTTLSNVVSISFAYGEVGALSTVDIRDGASIRASSLDVAAKNTANLAVSAYGVTYTDSASAVPTFVVTHADVSSAATIASGATIDVGELTVEAVNTNNFATTATSMGLGAAAVGIAASIFTADTAADAQVGADLSGLSHVTISALDRMERNRVSASTTTGSGLVVRKALGLTGIESVAGKLRGQLDGKFSLSSKSGATEQPKIAGAVSFAETTHSANAAILDGTEIDASGDVAVVAEVQNARVQNHATSSVESNSKGTEQDPTANLSLSAAVGYGNYTHNATAVIGDGATVRAARVGVRADTLVPYEITWHKWEGISTITSKLNSWLGVQNGFLTGFANAAGSASQLGVAGSVSYLDFTNNATAYLGKGASVIVTGQGDANWSSKLTDGSTLLWDAPVAIVANSHVEGAYAIGNITLTLNGAGGDPGAASAGGAYGQINYSANTRAFVAEGAHIGPDEDAGADPVDVAVTALSNESLVVVGPTAGRGASFGLNGVFAFANINNVTEASIDDEARVTARNLSLNAADDVISWAVTGAFNKSESAGVGISTALNNVWTNTAAFIGDNDVNSPKGSTMELATGSVKADGVSVIARTDGRIETISVGLAAATNSNPSGDKSGGWKNSVGDALKSAFNTVQGWVSKSSATTPESVKSASDATAAADDKSEKPAGQKPSEGTSGQTSDQQQPKFGVGVSGSASVNVMGLTTEAYIDRAVVTLTDGDASLAVGAVNDTDIGAFSGSAALVRANNSSSKFSAGVAGSLAVNVLQNSTTAGVKNSALSGVADADVFALAGGEQIAVALGVAVNASKEQENGASAAGSVSVSVADNSVGAEIRGSTVEGVAESEQRGNLDVVAYDRSRLGTGGGSLLAGGKAGLGAAITYSGIHNTTTSSLSGATISGFENVNVQAYNAALIGAAGAMGGLQVKEKSGTLAGAFVISVIGNRTSAEIASGSSMSDVKSVDVLAKDTAGIAGLDAMIDSHDCTGDECPELAPFLDYRGADLRADTEMIKGAQSSADGAGDAANNATEDAGDAASEAASDEDSGKNDKSFGDPADPLEGDAPLNGSSIISVAGVAQGGGNNVGISFAWNDIANTFSATVSDSDVAAAESLNVEAESNATIIGLSVGAGVANKFAGGGSVTVNRINNEVTAALTASGAARRVDVGALGVKASDNSDINSLAGNVTVSGSSGGAAAGITVAFNGINNQVNARIDGVDVEVDGAAVVSAKNDAAIRTLALAAAATGGNASLAGSLALSEIGNTTLAEIHSDAGNTVDAGSLSVQGSDGSVIIALAGQLSAGGKAAVGGSAAVNWIANETRARVDGANVTSPGAVTVDAANTSAIWTASASGGSEKVAVNGSATVAVIDNTTEAEVLAADEESLSAESLAISAKDAAGIYALAGQLSGGGNAAVGGAVVHSQIFNTTRAALTGMDSQVNGASTINAHNASVIISVAASGGGSQTAAVGGSVTSSFIGNETTAEVTGPSNKASLQTGSLDVTADDNAMIATLAGQFSGAGNTAVGAAAAVSYVGNSSTARVSSVDIISDGAVYVGSGSDTLIVAAALAGQGSGTAAVGGSNTTNIVANNAVAEVDSDSDTSVEAAQLNVEGKDSSAIFTIAGQLSGAGNAAVGAAVTVNVVTNMVKARIDGVDVAAASAVTLDAESDSLIVAVGVSGQGAGTAAVGASATTNTITNETVAEIVSENGDTIESSSLAVDAEDNSRIFTLAGQLSGSGTAAVGGAAAVATITNTTRSAIQGANVDVEGSTSLKGTNTSLIIAAAASGGASGTAAVGAGAATAFINNDTIAEVVSSGDRSVETGSLTLTASDTSDIYSLGGQASGAGTASVGGAVSVSEIGNEVRARIIGTDVTAEESVSVDAINASTIRTVAVSAQAAGSAAVGGSITTNIILNETVAEICSSGRCVDDEFTLGGRPAVSENVTAKSVRVTASDESEIDSLAGQVQAAGPAAVGGAVAHNQIRNATRARVGGVHLAVNQSTHVEAANDSVIRTLSSSGGLAVNASVRGSVSSAHINNVTEADLVDAGATGSGNDVRVLASDRATISSLSGVLAGTATGGGVGMALAVNQIGNSTKAHVSGSAAGREYSLGNLLVKSDSQAKIQSIAVGIGAAAVGGGVAGSTAVDLINNETLAYIDAGASVLAQNNVGVVAWSDDQITNAAGVLAAAGKGAGVGLSVTVSELGGRTSAYIQGEETSVTALAKDSSKSVEVAEGGLTGSLNLESALEVEQVENFNPLLDLASYRKTKQVTGVAVNASGTHHIQNFGANAAVGFWAGVGGITNVSVIAGTTEAYVRGAAINGRDAGSAGAGQSLHVGASDHAFSYGAILSAAAGVGGVGAAINTNVFDRDTRAYVRESDQVDAKHTVSIDANSTQNAASIAAGASGGVGGVAGSANVGVFTGSTEAYVDDATIRTRHLAVNAEHAARLFVSVGGAAIGAGAFAGAIAVSVDQSTTRAYVNGSDVNASGDVAVNAQIDSEVQTWGASGSAGLSAGVAGSAVVSVVLNTTEAYVKDSSVGESSSRAGSFTVTAQDRIATKNRVGAAGVGFSGPGVGAAASVTYVGNTTTAYVQNTDAYTTGDITIDAQAERYLSTIAATGGLGISGLSGVAAVTLVGAHLSGDVMDELDRNGAGTLSRVNQLVDGDRLVTEGDEQNIELSPGVEEGGEEPITSRDLDSVNNTGRIDVKDLLGAGSLGSTTATVRGGSTLDAGDDVTVRAEVRDLASIVAGGAAAGVGALGASIGILNIVNDVDAAVIEGSRITSRGSIRVHALTGRLTGQGGADLLCDATRAASVCSYQGSGGVVSLGAAVAVNTVHNNVTARATRGVSLEVQTGNGELALSALDSTDMDATAQGYQAGGAAAGAVSAVAEKKGATQALIGDNGSSGPAMTVKLASGSLNLTSERSGSVDALTIAGAGGVAAAVAGSGASATDDGDVKSVIGNHVNVDGVYAAVALSARAVPQVSAIARGYGGSVFNGLGVAAAVAKATPTVEATIGTGGRVTARALDVSAVVTQNGSNSTAESYAEAAGVGLLGYGANATVSTASSVSTVLATIGSTLQIGSNVRVLAGNATSQRAEVTGVTGGIAALGANVANANAESSTRAIVHESVTGHLGGSLSVNAAGLDGTYSKAFSGSGGLIAGAAAVANTSNASTTTAELGADDGLSARTIDVSASHEAQYNGEVDSLNASVLGASGSVTSHDIDATVNARILDEAALTAYDLSVLAQNVTRKPALVGNGFNAKAGSGGIAGGAAVVSRSDIDLTTNVHVGDGAAINVIGEWADPGRTNFIAVNDIVVRDRVKLDVGGAISVARSESRADVDASANVKMGSDVTLDTVGTAVLGARTRADVETSANAKTYGAAGAAQGISESNIRATEFVHVGADTSIRTDGDISLYAGRDAEGRENALRAIARTDLYNKTAFPVETDPEADAIISRSGTITVAGGAKLRSVGDVNLLTANGYALSDGQGTGTDLYRALAEDIADAFGADVSLKLRGGSSRSSVSTGVTVEGFLDAGIQNKQFLIIATDGTIEQQTDGVSFTITNENLATNLVERLKQLYELRAAYGTDPDAQAAFTAEINFVKQQLRQMGYPATDPNEGSSFIVDKLNVQFINVADVLARGGNINVTGDYLAGSGELRAASDAEITIENNSSRFLRVNRLTIEDTGGHVYFNQADVTGVAMINALNRLGSPLANFTIEASGTSDVRPTITVHNTYNPFIGGGNSSTPAPDIEITGDITNRTGTVNIQNVRGNIKLLGQGDQAAPSITANTVNLRADNGTIMQSYVNGFVHVGGDPRSLWSDVANTSESNGMSIHQRYASVKALYDQYDAACNPDDAIGQMFCNMRDALESTMNALKDASEDAEHRPGGGSWIAGNNIFISARYLNINGTIQSGIPDWQVTLGTSLQSEIDAMRKSWIRQGRPNISDPGDYAPYQLTGFAGGPLGRIAAYFNPETNQIVLDGVQVQGGYAELYGEIMNTGGGKIRVMDGYGRINVNNQLPYDIVVSGLDNGGDIEGIVRITDTSKRSNGTPITTVFERIGSRVRTQTWAADRLLTQQTASSAGRKATYNPVNNIRYVWKRGQDFTETWVGRKEESSWFDIFPGDTDEYDTYTKVADGDAVDLPDGQYVDRSSQGHNYEFTSKEYQTSSPKRVDHQEWSECNSFNLLGWCVGERTYYVKDTYKQGSQKIYTHSVMADHAIPIEFIGYDAGDSAAAINVTSVGDIIIAGSVSNTGGRVQLRTTGGAITQSAQTATVVGREIDLNAQNGIGSITGITTRLEGASGSLTALTSRGDISIRSLGQHARVAGISTGAGNVALDADGSIVQASSGNTSVITGERVELVSRQGGIGTSSQALNLSVGTSEQGGLNATAQGDISVRQTDRDFHLISVESFAGDVRIEAANGSIVDANRSEKKDQRTIDQLEQLWDDMRLIDGEGAEESAQDTISAYKGAKKSEYELYWRLRGVAPILDENGDVVGYTAETFDPTQAGDIMDPEQYGDLHNAYGKGTYDPNFTYQLSAAEEAELTEGSAWTKEQLQYAVGGGILFKQTTSTETRIEDPNVKGRNVTLLARSGSVGTDNGEIVITSPEDLKNEDVRIALAAAETDDVAVDTETGTVTVLLRDSVDVAATGTIDVEGNDHVYLGSRQPLYVKAVESGGSIRVKGTEGLYDVSLPGTAAISGGNTIVEGGDGGIGSAADPLTLALKTGAELTARAAQDMYINELFGDLNVAQMYGEGDIHLRARGSILTSGASPVTIQGSSIDLVAEEGSVGGPLNPLALMLSPTGVLSAEAGSVGAGIYVNSLANVVNLGNLTAGGSILLRSAGDMHLQGEMQATTSVDLRATGSITQEATSRVRTFNWMTQTATGQALTGNNSVSRFQAKNGESGDIALRNTASSLEITEITQGAGAITVTHAGSLITGGAVSSEGGNITLQADGDLTMSERVQTEGDVSLTADGAIAQTGAGRVLTTARLTTVSRGAQSLTGANTVQSFVATNTGAGDIELTNTVDALELLGVAQSDGAIVVTQVGDLLASGAVASDGGEIQLSADGDITITERVATEGNVTLTAGGSLTQTGAGRILDAGLLTAVSSGAQVLNGANTVERFLATNTGAGEIQLNNSSDSLEIVGIDQGVGAMSLTQTGDLITSGAVIGDGGAFTFTVDGDITIGEQFTTAGPVTLTANGSILQTGAGRFLESTRLTTVSNGAQTLNGPNAVQSFRATNNGAGDIQLTNESVALEILGVDQGDGAIVITQVGKVVTSGAVEGDGGDITFNVEGDITIGERLATTGDVSLSADGSIEQTGVGRILDSARLTTVSNGAQTLNGANTVRSFRASNTGSGALELTNTAASLEILGVDQGAGAIVITHIGDLVTSGAVESDGGAITFNVEGGITMGERLTTTGDVSLTADGSIEQTGVGRILDSTRLTTVSNGAQTLNGANTVRSFRASNTGSGALELTNTAASLEILGVDQGVGALVVTQDGALVTSGPVEGDGGAMTFNVDGDITIGERLATTGDVSLTAAGSIVQAGAGRILDAAQLRVVSTGPQTLTGANTVKGFHATNMGMGAITLNNTAGTLEILGITQGADDVSVTQTGDLAVSGVILTGADGDVDLWASGSILNRNPQDDVIIDTRNIELTADTGSIGEVEDRIVVDATGIINATASQDIYLEERGGDLVSEYLRSHNGSIDLLALYGGISVDSITAPKAISMRTVGNVSLTELGTGQLNILLMTPGSELFIDKAYLSEGGRFQADTVRLNQLIHDGEQRLRMDVRGVNGMADSVTLHAQSDVGIIFDRLESDYALIAADADDLQFLHTVIGSVGRFNNSHHTARVDNVNKELFDVDLQLYAPDRQVFYLIFAADRMMMTDAYDVNYDPDYIETHFATENSFVRITSKMPDVVGVGPFRSPGGTPGTEGAGGDFETSDEENAQDEDQDDDESDEDEGSDEEPSDGGESSEANE